MDAGPALRISIKENTTIPYIKQERRFIKKNYDLCKDPGELNYLLTLVLIECFKKVPSYDTLHILRRDFVTRPKENQFLQTLRSKLADRFTTADIYTAAAEAFFEFRIRVGVAYEEKKIELNGDLPEYEELVKMIETMQAPVDTPEQPVQEVRI